MEIQLMIDFDRGRPSWEDVQKGRAVLVRGVSECRGSDCYWFNNALCECRINCGWDGGFHGIGKCDGKCRSPWREWK